MSKVLIEFDDENGQVSIVTTVTGYADDSKACQIAERVLMFVDRIAERQGKEEIAPKLIQVAGEINAKRVTSLSHIASEPVIIHAHLRY